MCQSASECLEVENQGGVARLVKLCQVPRLRYRQRSPGSGIELSPLKVPRLRYRTVASEGPQA